MIRALNVVFYFKRGIHSSARIACFSASRVSRQGQRSRLIFPLRRQFLTYLL